MAAAIEKTQAQKLFSAIYDINQVLKRFTKYSYLAEEGLFIGISDNNAYEFIYAPSIDTEVCPELFSKSFIVNDGDALFNILKDIKGLDKKYLEFEDRNLINCNGESIQVTIMDEDEIKQKYSILDTLEKVEDGHLLIDSTESALYFDDEKISDSFTVNDIDDVLKKNVSQTSDHTLPLFQLRTNELRIYSEFTKININEDFLILDCNVFKKIKILKKDEPFLDFYLVGNKVIINYGVSDREQFTISVNGIIRL